MSREVRMVPPGWGHPKNYAGEFLPLHEQPNSSVDVMRTHYQMYETTSEGTPISPVMETPEALARWLADNGASAFGKMTATYAQWLNMITGDGCAPSAAFVPGVGIISGVEMLSRNQQEETK